MLDSEPIAADALGSTSVPRTPKQVVAESSVSTEKGTQLLDVTVVDRNPAYAQKLANGIADAFVSKVKAFNNQPGPGSLPSVPAYIFQRPDLPSARQSTGLIRNMVLGGFFGLLVALGVVLFLDYLDVTIKTASEAEERLQLPVLGFIPYEARGGALGVLEPARAVFGYGRETSEVGS
jgi:capsular polysaccharide biosynthesis protein